MAPMLEDEIMHDTEKMNSKVAGIVRTGKQIYDFIEQLKAKNTAPGISDNSLPFSFSGQITDLSYFNTSDILPKEVIENIPDAELKEAVISNLELAEKQGLINVNLDSGNITLTDSGREYISNPNFISAANINKAHSAIRAMEIQHGLESDTVNITEVLESGQARLMLSNSEFVVLLQQKKTDLDKVIELFNLSPSQSSYLKTGEKGTGLIVSGKKIIPFDRRISKDSSIYNLCQTDFRRDVT